MTISAESLRAGRDRAPALVILGAPRSGTTSLARWLADTRLVGVGAKDSFYLMDDDAGLRGPAHLRTHGVNGYLRLFPAKPEPSVECTAGYLYQRTALDFFETWREPPHFVVVARDPIERLRSVHRYFTGNLGALPREMTFTEYVDALFEGRIGLLDQTVANAHVQGRYAEWLELWLRTFGRRRVTVISFDDLKVHPDQIVSRLLDLAGASAWADLTAYDFQPRNESYIPRSRVLSVATAAGRRVVPTGRLREWGGRRIHRLQARAPQPSEHSLDPEHATLARLREYYQAPNAELAERYGIATAAWSP